MFETNVFKYVFEWISPKKFLIINIKIFSKLFWKGIMHIWLKKRMFEEKTLFKIILNT
jgi:hypothetical protein